MASKKPTGKDADSTATNTSTPLDEASHTSTPIKQGNANSTPLDEATHNSTPLDEAAHNSTPLNEAERNSASLDATSHNSTPIESTTPPATALPTMAQPGAVRSAMPEGLSANVKHASDAFVTPASQFSRNSENYTHRKSSSKGRKRAVIAIVVILVIAIVAIGLFIAKEMRKSTFNAELHTMDQEQLAAVDQAVTGTQTFDEPFIVLLIGSDVRDDDPDMGARSDTNILARVDPVNNVVSLLSIQRDTMIDLEGVGTTKFNAAYTYGGPSGTIEAVKKLTGVDIDHYAEINFEGLVGLIDAVGGVDVEVEELIDDPEAMGYIEPGMQHLDGEHALVFARSRAYSDGDYTRATNQRKLLEAVAHKLLETPATELAGVIRSSASFLTTDSGMDFDFMYSVADQMRHNDEKPTIDIYSANLPSSPANIDGVSYVIADTWGIEDMITAFLAGEDIGKVDLSSSIDDDIEAAGATAGYGELIEDTGSDYYYDYSGDGYTYDYSNTEGTYSDGYDSTGYSDTTGTGETVGDGAYTDAGTY